MEAIDSIEISKYSGICDSKTKCGEILVSFTTLNWEFICILCNDESKYHSFADFSDHVRNEHTLCSEDGDPQVCVDDEYTTEAVATEDPLSDKMSDLDGEEIETEYDCDRTVELSISPTGIYEPPKVTFHSVTDVNRIRKRDTVTFTKQCPKDSKQDESKEIKEKDTPNRQHIVNLLEMYRKCIGLWHTKTAGCTSNELKAAILRLLVKKYETRSSVAEMRNLLKRMTMCFNAAWEANAEVDYRPWYFDKMYFLKYADVETISDKEFDDFECPFCMNEELIASCAMDLWNHIIENHTESGNGMESGSNIIPLQWPTEHILQFIYIYREQECLWNIKCREYHNRPLKVKAYQTIIDKFKKIRPNVLKNRESVRDAIRHLRDYFRRVDKKFQVSSLLDQTETTDEDGNHKIYEELLFLKNVYMPRSIHSSETYSCDICGRSFKRKTDINAHYRTQHSDSAFKCDRCPMVFGSQLKLKTHRSTHDRSDGKTYNCPICHLNYSDSDDLATHLIDHLPNKLHEQICEICGAKFEERNNLLIHIRRHSNTKNYVCDVCQKRFVTSTELKSHAVVHSNEKPFICEVCGLGFKYLNRLNTHHLVHEEPRFKCKDCDMKFITKRHLSEHERSHAYPDVPVEKIVCAECQSLFRNPDSLARHKRKIHNIRKRNICDYSEDENSQVSYKRSK